MSDEVPVHYDHSAIKDFIDYQSTTGRRIVLITSGGTIVPLEKEHTRCIDNFSRGTRGRASAEYFLQLGYGVIFLHRQGSLQPFTRAPSDIELLRQARETETGSLRIEIDDPEMIARWRRLNKVERDCSLMEVHFTTLDEYLSLLREIAILMRPQSSKTLFYLAAAVSDFIPASLPEHKIQSSDATLELKLVKAPKILQTLIEDRWAPKAFICSFKLETDPSLLIKKARSALTNYGHQCVVANLLSRRAFEVVLVTDENEEWLTLSPDQISEHIEIEAELVRKIVEKHTSWIATQTPIALD